MNMRTYGKWILGGSFLFVGCSADMSTSGSDMALFQQAAEQSSLEQACAEVEQMCKEDGAGCDCYDFFCKERTETSICDKLENACVADCAQGDDTCERACTMHEDSCGKGAGKGHHGKGDHDGDSDSDSDEATDEGNGDHDGSCTDGKCGDGDAGDGKGSGSGDHDCEEDGSASGAGGSGRVG